MDQTDRDLLTHLQRNAKLTYAELGRRVGLVVSTVNERLKKLQARGIIRAYVAVVNPKALGLDTCAFVQVLMTEPGLESAFVAQMHELPEVQECHCITGEFSYLLKVRVPDTTHLEAFLREKIKSVAGVARTQTMIALSTSKETLALGLSAGSAAQEKDAAA